MPQPRHLNAAPIVEGIVDIQAKLPAGLDVGIFRSIAEKLGFGGKGQIEELHMMSFVFNPAAGTAPQQKNDESGPVGLRLFSEDRLEITQMRKNGFTFSRLTPYTSWEDIFPRVARLFKAYCSVAQPEEITRLAVRNINRILLPREKLRTTPGLYLTSPPVFPKDDSSIPVNWMTRFLLRRPDSKLDAFVTQVSEDSPVDGKHTIILDIDVFGIGPLPLDPDALLPRLHVLRTWKNTLFFEALTEETLNQFS